MEKKHTIVRDSTLLLSAVESMILNQTRIIYITNENEKLLGVFSEGDIIRRAISNRSFDVPISKVMVSDFDFAERDYETNLLKDLMIKKKHIEIPIIDEDGRIISIISIHDLIE